MPRDRERPRYKERRSSSHSSESSYERKKSRSKHKRRSRDRSGSSGRRKKRSSSRSRLKRRSFSKSVSRERYESRSKRRSLSRSRSKRSKYSRDRSRSQSSTRDRKYTKSNKKHKKHSHSRSRSNSFDIEPRIHKVNLDDTGTKVEKAIKAAEAAGLTMTKIPTYEYKDVSVKEDMPTIHDRNLLDELNGESFIQKAFVSSRSQKQNIVIDLNAETVKVPEAEVRTKKDASIINFDEVPCQEELKELWIKKLYQFRKKMLKGEI